MNLIYFIVVVVCQFLMGPNIVTSKEHDMRHTDVFMIVEDVLCIEVGGATMIDKFCKVSHF